MNQCANVDPDAVLRAQTTLLGSGRIGLHQQIDAYRVLAKVSPSAYLPRLVEALLSLSYGEFHDPPETCLAVRAEAVGAARQLDALEPKRTTLLVEALDAYQRQLYMLGRRTEGFSVREEMARIGRQGFEAGQVRSPVYGLEPLAAALAEDGRHHEAARACGEVVEAERAEHGRQGASFWSVLAWAAELDAAGLHGAALDTFRELVATTREELEEGRTSLANLLWELVRFSQMLDAQGRLDEARSARREAGALLAELAESGERKSWSNILAWWAVLLGLSGRAHEQSAPGAPAPPFGLYQGWSPDVRQQYYDGRAELEEAIAVLVPLAAAEPRSHLAELVTLQRRLTIRSALYWERQTHRILERLQPLFDEGVVLARRLAACDEGQGTAALAGALTDRSTLLVAGKRYAEALADFKEAAELVS